MLNKDIFQKAKCSEQIIQKQNGHSNLHKENGEQIIAQCKLIKASNVCKANCTKPNRLKQIDQSK